MVNLTIPLAREKTGNQTGTGTDGTQHQDWTVLGHLVDASLDFIDGDQYAPLQSGLGIFLDAQRTLLLAVVHPVPVSDPALEARELELVYPGGLARGRRCGRTVRGPPDLRSA